MVVTSLRLLTAHSRGVTKVNHDRGWAQIASCGAEVVAYSVQCLCYGLGGQRFEYRQGRESCADPDGRVV